MKTFKEVENTKKQYHADATINSVHRTSLLVPEHDGVNTEISFLNHFLIKRGYKNIACRITGINKNGEKINSKLYNIDKPIVYSFDLTNIFNKKAKSYMVEFFSSENLFIPFPAVIVNHSSKNFLNTVHSYNRVLNDIFEDDDVNKVYVPEASIDVRVDKNFDTFVTFQAGMHNVNDTILFEYISNEFKFEKKVNINVKRFNTQSIFLSELIPDIEKYSDGILKVYQPKQKMFYGRMLVGIKKRNTECFSANHSYYDSSNSLEYWDKNEKSFRIYPFFQSMENIIKMYPIQSKSELCISTNLFNMQGEKLGQFTIGNLISPGRDKIAFNINNLAIKNKIKLCDIAAFELLADGIDKIPTRCNHQLIYSKSNLLGASINVSLLNSQMFKKIGKNGFSWGQIIYDSQNKSQLGFVFNSSEGKTDDIEIKFYDDHGECGKITKTLNNKSSLIIDVNSTEFKNMIKRDYLGKYIWYVAYSKRSDLMSYSVSTNTNSGFSSGEHSF